MTEIAESSNSIIRVKIGNKEYPVVRSNRCGVCMHPARYAIEEKLLLNYGYPSISRWVSDHSNRNVDGTTEEWPEITTKQLRYHRDQGHCPMSGEMIHELAKRRAEAQGIDLEEYRSQFVDHVVANDIVLQLGMERLIKGEIEPDVKDVLAASKLRAELEAANASNVTQEQWQDLFMLYFRKTREIAGDQVFRQIMSDISEDPAFKAFQQRRTIEGKVV